MEVAYQLIVIAGIFLIVIAVIFPIGIAVFLPIGVAGSIFIVMFCLTVITAF